MTRNAARPLLPVLLLLPALLVGCDTSLDLAATSNSFSLFGLLDAGDSRHAVRVEALQDGKPFGADSTLDATVTLTHVESGRTVGLEDRLVSFEGLTHNYVTDAMDLRLNNTYRLAVQRGNGEGSTATLTMPHETPKLSLSQGGMVATVKGGTEDQLLYLDVNYHTTVVPENCSIPPCAYDRVFSPRYAQRAQRTESGYTASFDWVTDVDSLYSGQKATVTLKTVSVQVGLVHSSAPTYEGLTKGELFRPGVAPSNVENGYGYVAGITSDEASFTYPPPRPPRPKIPVP